MLYSFKNHYPTKPPERLRFPDGRTRTNPSTFSDWELLELGYVKVPEPPSISSNEELLWTGSSWEVKTKEPPVVDLQSLREDLIRQVDQKLQEIEWRYQRYQRLQRLGTTQIDNLSDLDTYSHRLMEIRNQEDPTNVEWPDLP